MANFNGLILTQAGANLQDKIAVSGATLQFTRAAIGDGLWPAGLDPTSLTGLVSEKQSLAIQGLTDEGTGQHKISVLVDNTGLAVGFMTREIGVFADDPDLGEILYQVTNADSPDYLPPDVGATHIEMALDLIVVTSSASSVTAVINEGLVYARKEDVSAEAAERQAADDLLAAALDAHEGNTDNPHGTTKAHVGLGLVENCAVATQAEAQAGTADNVYMTPLRVAQAISALGTVPPGAVMHFAANPAPAGWLKCNGAVISRTTYADLFAAIGTKYGAGDGSTTFKLPDLRGEFVRGWDDGRGVDSGRAFGSVQPDGIRHHVHTYSGNYCFDGSDHGGYSYPVLDAPSNGTVSGITLANDTVGAAPETRSRNVALLACIKY